MNQFLSNTLPADVDANIKKDQILFTTTIYIHQPDAIQKLFKVALKQLAFNYPFNYSVKFLYLMFLSKEDIIFNINKNSIYFQVLNGKIWDNVQYMNIEVDRLLDLLKIRQNDLPLKVENHKDLQEKEGGEFSEDGIWRESENTNFKLFIDNTICNNLLQHIEE